MVSCKRGILQPPVSCREIANVEIHCKAMIKNTISPITFEVVKRGSFVPAILAFRMEEIMELCRRFSSVVTLKINAIELTKTSLAAKVVTSATPTRQSKPSGFIKGSIIFPKSDA